MAMQDYRRRASMAYTTIYRLIVTLSILLRAHEIDEASRLHMNIELEKEQFEKAAIRINITKVSRTLSSATRSN